MKASFSNSVSVLVRAYMNDTLEHGLCACCAVGNLLGGKADWAVLFQTDSRKRVQKVAEPGTVLECFQPSDDCQIWYERAQDAIKKSGYSQEQLMQIEYAFEMAPRGRTGDDWMFNGLMAVVDVLAEIHGVDLTTKESAIGQFKEVQLSKA